MTAPNGFNGRDCALKLEMSEQIDLLAKALVQVQSQVHGVAKTTANDYFKSKYADLAACIEATREQLIENGLAITQYPCVLDSGGPGLVTLLLHESGQWIRGVMPIKPVKEGPQPFGSEYTYMRRYSYAGILGLAQVDDDAESATFRMSKIMETKIRKALDSAMEAEDYAKGLETWLELNDDEKKFIWNGMSDRFYKQKMNAFLKAAQDAEDGKSDPNLIEPLAPEFNEKDARRERVRAKS